MANFETYNPAIDNDSEETDALTYPGLDSRTDTSSNKTSRTNRGGARGKNNSSQGRRPQKKKGNTVSITEQIRLFMTDGHVRVILALFALLLGAYLFIAFISYVNTGFHDQSEIQNVAAGMAVDVENPAGEGGARLSELFINDSFGLASIVIIFWLFALAMKWFGAIRFKTVNFTIKCLVALITASLIIGLLNNAVESHFMWGGVHGYFVNERIIHYVGWIGAVLLCILLCVIFFVICLNDIYKYFKRLAQKRRDTKEKEEEKLRKIEELQRKISELQALEEEEEKEMESESETDSFLPPAEDMTFDNITYIDTDINNDADSDNVSDNQAGGQLEDADYEEPEDGLMKKIPEEPATPAGDMVLESNAGVMTVTVNEIGKAVEDDSVPDVFDPTAELSNYKFPGYSLLKESQSKISVDQNEQLENQEKIRSTLADFGIAITEIKATVGPTVTLYEIRPDKGVRISRIRSIGDDIALSLAAKGVRIIAPIPGKGTVGIEVANKDPQTVSMRTIITSKAYQDSSYELPLAIGSTIDNKVYMADLTKMPHLMVAGATGKGKSVGLNAMIVSLLYRKHPSQLKFVLVDPKEVEFSLYQALKRHYLAKLPDEEEAVVTKPEKAVTAMLSLCVEMGLRYNLLKQAGVRNIQEYNAKFIKKVLNPEKGHRYMPYIVVIIDEFADLIMTAGKEIETPIARLAQKARAIGIHVILATQRPSANVITGIIKANFPARIAFAVASGIDSRTVLDTMGAEHLIGRGDMLISLNSEMERIQCAFIDTPEVTAICEHIGNQAGYPHEYLLPEPQLGSEGEYTGGNESFGDRDPLFDEAARFVISTNTASTSSLQRRYSIGYNRAGKIMDQMEAAGIVGPASGSKPRQVLVDAISLETILKSGY